MNVDDNPALSAADVSKIKRFSKQVSTYYNINRSESNKMGTCTHLAGVIAWQLARKCWFLFHPSAPRDYLNSAKLSSWHNILC